MGGKSFTISMSETEEFTKNQQQKQKQQQESWKKPQREDSLIKSENFNGKAESKLPTSSSNNNGGNRCSRSDNCRPRSVSPPRTRVPYDWEEFSSIVIEPERGVHNSNDLPNKRRASRKWSFKDLLYRSSSEGRDQRKEIERMIVTRPPPVPAEKKTKDTKQADQLVAGKPINGRSGSRKPTTAAVSPASAPHDNNKKITVRKKVAVSVHELYYQANRAHAEELKRKSFLPYRQGLLGCLGSYPSTATQYTLQSSSYR
ncbi:hypothetical protein KI387_010560 [Taxus chinensis]|uniref:Uncharacterized protein n=1 Tax=Taxus chinensis TaxID=29808 RepID=A0AA38KJC5_TAXCH|nr:hypothetical protein KI387_010560 [Taxus chinensis]